MSNHRAFFVLGCGLGEWRIGRIETSAQIDSPTVACACLRRDFDAMLCARQASHFNKAACDRGRDNWRKRSESTRSYGLFAGIEHA
jgi:hypothetical protein